MILFPVHPSSSWGSSLSRIFEDVHPRLAKTIAEKKCFRRLRTWKQVGSAQRRLDEEARAAAEAAQLRADLEAAFSFLRIL